MPVKQMMTNGYGEPAPAVAPQPRQQEIIQRSNQDDIRNEKETERLQRRQQIHPRQIGDRVRAPGRPRETIAPGWVRRPRRQQFQPQVLQLVPARQRLQRRIGRQKIDQPSADLAAEQQGKPILLNQGLGIFMPPAHRDDRPLR